MAKPGGMILAIGMGKPKRGGPEPDAPESLEDESPRPAKASMPLAEKKEPEPSGGGGTISPEDVGYVYPDQHCSGCEHFGEGGQCGKYGFQCEPEGGCLFGFSPRMDEEPEEGMEMESAGMPRGA